MVSGFPTHKAWGVALHPEFASLGYALAGFVTDASGPRRGNHALKVSFPSPLSTTQRADQVDSFGRGDGYVSHHTCDIGFRYISCRCYVARSFASCRASLCRFNSYRSKASYFPTAALPLSILAGRRPRPSPRCSPADQPVQLSVPRAPAGTSKSRRWVNHSASISIRSSATRAMASPSLSVSPLTRTTPEIT